jgi:hypothetical protein
LSVGESIVIFRTSDSEQLGLADGDEPLQIESIDDVVEKEITEDIIVANENGNYNSLNEFFYLGKVYDPSSIKIVKEISELVEDIYRPKHEEFLQKDDVVEFYESLKEVEYDSFEGNFAPESEVVAWNV